MFSFFSKSTPEPPVLLFKTDASTPLRLDSPYRGTLVIAGPAANKSATIAAPLIEQFTRLNYAGLVYSSGAPLVRSAPGPVTYRHLTFEHVAHSVKVNPWRPQDLLTRAAANDCAHTLLANLSPGGAKSGDNFFTKSAEAYLTGIIWFYRNNYPALCTIPHVVETALQADFVHVISMISEDTEARQLVLSLLTALEHGAEKMVAGIIASLHVLLAPLRTPEVCWLFTPDEAKGEGFSLSLNDPKNPTLLSITPALQGNRSAAQAAVLSCVVARAINQMNLPHKLPSYVLVDADETIHVPDLDMVFATCRGHKLAVVYLTPGMAQLIDTYGQDRAQVLVSCAGNRFFGHTTGDISTEKIVSIGGNDSFSAGAPDSLSVNEFVGEFASEKQPVPFRATLVPALLPPPLSPPSLSEVKACGNAAQAQAELVALQVAQTLQRHPLPGLPPE